MPKAMVTESNGEISCSIEETNRIRKQLGLRPLDVEEAVKPTGSSSNPVAVAPVPLASAESTNAGPTEGLSMRERLKRAREKRAAAFKGKSLGQQLAAEKKLSAADWIKYVHARCLVCRVVVVVCWAVVGRWAWGVAVVGLGHRVDD